MTRASRGGFLEWHDLVVAFVKRGPDQVVHAGVDDLEGLGGALLFVEAAGQQHAGVADDETAGLQQDLRVPRSSSSGTISAP